MLSITDNLLRLLNFVFLVISMSFISTLLNTGNGNSSRVNYCMFAAAYAITTDSIYGLFANFWEPLTWPIISFILDFLNFVFIFTAGTVLAVGIRAHSCKNQDYLDRNKITQGSETRCRVSQAAVAFFYFSMAIFLAKAIMSLINLITNGLFGSAASSPFGSRFSKRRRQNQPSQVGVPPISQI